MTPKRLNYPLICVKTTGDSKINVPKFIEGGTDNLGHVPKFKRILLDDLSWAIETIQMHPESEVKSQKDQN